MKNFGGSSFVGRHSSAEEEDEGRLAPLNQSKRGRCQVLDFYLADWKFHFYLTFLNKLKKLTFEVGKNHQEEIENNSSLENIFRPWEKIISTKN